MTSRLVALAAAALVLAAGPAAALGARFRCQDGTVGAVRFPDARTGLLVLGGRSIPMRIAPSGSGARYVGPGLTYWEHQGTVTIEQAGRSRTCAIARR